MKIYLGIGLSLCLSYFARNAEAQFYSFRNYSIEDGLPQSQVYSICQDGRGALWFGTAGGGVACFDGKNFSRLTVNEGLSSNQITVIIEDKIGNLWFGTKGGGICKYDGLVFKTYNTDNGLSGNEINDIYEDNTGVLWVATTKGIDIIKDSSITNFNIIDTLIVNSIVQEANGNMWFATSAGILEYAYRDEPAIDIAHHHYTIKNSSLPSNEAAVAYGDSSGTIWFGTSMGVAFLDNAGRKNRIFKNINASQGLVGYVKDITADAFGNIWFGTYGEGLYKFDPKKPVAAENILRFNMDNGLCKNLIFSLSLDRTGNIWIGTDGGGVCKFDGGTFVQYNTSHGLSYNHVSAIYEDHTGKIWLGTYSNGVNIIDTTGEVKQIQFNEQDGDLPNTVLSISQDTAGNFWLGMDRGMVCRLGAKDPFSKKSRSFFTLSKGKKTADEVFSIVCDRRGAMWFGIRGGGVVKYDGNDFTKYNEDNSIISNKITVIVEDRRGNIWAGSENSGIFVFDGTHLHQYTLEKDGLCSNSILSMAKDSKGRLWVGTDGGGICFFDGTFFKNLSVNQKYGIDNNRVFSIIEDYMGNIWAGTQMGVNKIMLDEAGALQHIMQYGRNEGFNGTECNRNAVIEDRKGQLWFGTFQGAVKMNPEMDIYHDVIPYAFIRGVRLFFENINWKESGYELTNWQHLPVNLELENEQNHITFDFIGINQQATEKLRYRFILEGFDERWSPITETSSATYSNLPPGDYVFKVKSSVKDRSWNESIINFKFKIRPALWQRWWFYLLCILGVVIMVAFFIYLTHD